MLRMKLHFFIYLGGISPIIAFSPTLAKQLGYSPKEVGLLYTYLSILAFLVKPIFGFIVDQFPVKRIAFLSFIMISGVSVFGLQFVEKLPTEAVSILSCSDSTTILNVCSKTESLRLATCNERLSKRLNNVFESVTCQLSCQENEQFWDEICTFWNISADYCKTSNRTIKNKELDYLIVSLFTNTTYQGRQEDIDFKVKSVNIREKQIGLPVCNIPLSTRCKINCSNDVIMRLGTVTEYNESIFRLRQFWGYFIIMSIFWISQAVTWSIQDSICLDLLGRFRYGESSEPLCTCVVARYMEDLTLKYHVDKHSWIKTLQGAALFIQCLGDEMPFFFSGWIIIGYSYSMCLWLFGFYVRFYLCSIITNPVWILPIDLINGITFGLFHYVMVGYAKIIAPPNAVTTVVGFTGSLFKGVGLSLGGLLGGYTYEIYGGSWTYEIFS
ncbi:Major facilitator superfamily domain,Major facilitator superfamily associated domain [Cinara cedri]|uniref:Major facilitator superfamily domain,Major facilitator superfamily associated domain n=1 Tax=Cinara cedri TaxID=506608 RepID=A0A5E4N2F9_9HEMI|nr:Major facilitator superfamily domain,Major facilitator superfamily associated domain [Cinara cedri]